MKEHVIIIQSLILDVLILTSAVSKRRWTHLFKALMPLWQLFPRGGGSILHKTGQFCCSEDSTVPLTVWTCVVSLLQVDGWGKDWGRWSQWKENSHGHSRRLTSDTGWQLRCLPPEARDPSEDAPKKRFNWITKNLPCHKRRWNDDL